MSVCMDDLSITPMISSQNWDSTTSFELLPLVCFEGGQRLQPQMEGQVPNFSCYVCESQLSKTRQIGVVCGTVGIWKLFHLVFEALPFLYPKLLGRWTAYVNSGLKQTNRTPNANIAFFNEICSAQEGCTINMAPVILALTILCG